MSEDIFSLIPMPTDYSLKDKEDGGYRVTVVWDFADANALMDLVKVLLRHQMPTSTPRY